MAEKAESIKFRDGISGRNYFVMCKTREEKKTIFWTPLVCEDNISIFCGVLYIAFRCHTNIVA